TEQLDWKDQTVLDVGCGPGRYMAAIVSKRAKEVTGLDFAPAMIDIARRNLRDCGAESKCRLLTGDFMTTDFQQSFDTVAAIGYFDYILGDHALDEHFGRMWKLANKRVVASFPYRWSFKTLPRWIWLAMRNCPVRFFSKADVEALMKRLNMPRYKLVRMSGTILAVAEKA